MSSVLIVQLSDAHIKTITDPLVERWPALCRAIAAELPGDTRACVITFCGDAAFGGKADQFEIAAMLLDDLRKHLNGVKPEISVHILSVPGNHDCDLTSEDQDARLALREKVRGELPSPSILTHLLRPQKDYFDFALHVGEAGSALTPDYPFYQHYDLVLGTDCIRFNLLNSSWTSIIEGRDDLRFPLKQFLPPEEPEATVSVTLLHHPLHWFLMPDVRSELGTAVESRSDLVLTAHEHEDESARRIVEGGVQVNYLEGGVLGEHGTSDQCTFNLVQLDLGEKTQQTKTLVWSGDHFEPKDGSGQPTPIHNPQRADRRYAFKPSFEIWLDELEDPLTHPRVAELRLSHIFAYPDLRKMLEASEQVGDARSSPLVARVRSESVLNEIAEQTRVFIAGGDRSGKTSLAKRLCLDLRNKGYVPLFVRGEELSRSGSDTAFRRTLEKAVTKQYQLLSPAEYLQLNNGMRVLIIDDLHEGPTDFMARRHILNSASDRFDHIVLIASDDLQLEFIADQGQEADLLLGYQKYQICDFGHQRLESLTFKWMALGRSDPDSSKLKTSALELCQQVESLLGLAGLPHTPWLLVVILEQTEGSDAPEVAARNGNYGHLYHAVITVALSQSPMTHFDLSGKFIYLAELAYRLHKAGRPTLSEVEARSFHAEHCARYDLPFDYEKVRNDLIFTRMIRLDGDEIAFRSRWVSSFFVAWWLQRNLRNDEAKQVVRELTGRLYHETSANILVFLAHLTDDPLVIGSMREAASALFRDAPRATISDDVTQLNALCEASGFFTLPPTSPEINRKLIQDARDDQMAMSTRRSYDGRQVDALPPSGAHELDELQHVRAALKTIGILGQVLRNGASSIEGTEKLAIMEEIVGLARRLLGRIYSFQGEVKGLTRYIRWRLFRIRVATVVQSEDKDFKLGRAQLRELRQEAAHLANRLWFDLNWLATFSMIKRTGSAIGLPLLDSTLGKLRQKDDVLSNELVHLVVRLGRRGKSIPADEMVTLHGRLEREGNCLAKVVLEAMTWERLLLFETDYKQSQKLCQKMGIKVPAKSLDPSHKKFGTNVRRLPGK